MLTKENIQQLISEREYRIKVCREAGIREKDCMYEIGVFMYQSEIDFLKEVLDGKEKITKASIVNQLAYSDKMKERFVSEREKSEDDTDKHVNTLGFYSFSGKVELLKEIQERFFSEVKHRVSRKQRISVLEDEIDAIEKNMASLKRGLEEDDNYAKIHLLVLSDDITDRFTREMIKKNLEEGVICRINCKMDDGRYCAGGYYPCDYCLVCEKYKACIKPYFDMRDNLEVLKKELSELEELERAVKEKKEPKNDGDCLGSELSLGRNVLPSS